MTAFVNNVKTVVLLGLMTGLLVAVGGLMGRQYVVPFLAFAVLMNAGAWFFSDKIAIVAMRGKELTPQTGGDLYRMVDELRQRAGLPMPRVYLCPHAAPNAFATGRSPRRAAVAFTQGCIDAMGPDELAGIAAHELMHIKNRDTLTSCVAATIAGVLAAIAQWGFLLGLGRDRNSNPLVMLLVTIVAAVGAAMVKAAISRSREFVADAGAAQLVGSPDGLISALRRLDAMSRRVPLVHPNPAQNNLFIVEPLASAAAGGGGLVNLFATHPPTERRIAALQRLR
jgi:heat shock protein HtpX